MKQKIVLFLLASLVFVVQVFAHQLNTLRPDYHAPIGVMADHKHNKGEMMLSYRFMTMNMSKLHSGTDSLKTSSVLENYMMAPKHMRMDMHMFGFMYAPSNSITVMLMIPFVDNKMETVKQSTSTSMSSHMGHMMSMHNQSSSTMGSPTKMTNKSRGLGDISVSALYNFLDSQAQSLLFQFGLGLPTGSINEKNSQSAVLPYGMQLGSGTLHSILGVTYTKQFSEFSYGLQAKSFIYLGKNRYGYARGNKYNLQSWVSKPLNNSLSISARVLGSLVNDIRGKDKRLNVMMSPAAKTNQGKKQLDFSLGANYLATKGFFSNYRFAIEYTMPLYQDFNGIQLQLESSITAGLQKAF